MSEVITTTQSQIDTVLTNFGEFLKTKNLRYGDSALKPKGIFSKEDPVSQICVRLDDKISRVQTSSALRKNDVADICGYIVLLMIQNGWTTFDDLLD